MRTVSGFAKISQSRARASFAAANVIGNLAKSAPLAVGHELGDARQLAGESDFVRGLYVWPVETWLGLVTKQVGLTSRWYGTMLAWRDTVGATLVVCALVGVAAGVAACEGHLGDLPD